MLSNHCKSSYLKQSHSISLVISVCSFAIFFSAPQTTKASSSLDRSQIEIVEIDSQRSFDNQAFPRTETRDPRADQHINAYFGQVQLNLPSIRSWSIRNTGEVDITRTRFVISGMAFSASTTCPRVMIPHSECQVDVRFSPMTTGYHSAALDMIFDLGGNIYFDLWGYGAQSF